MSARKIVMRVVSISFSILVISLVVFALTKLGSYAYQFGYRVFTEQPVDSGEGRDVVVQLDAGLDGGEVGEMLESKGLIRDGNLFAVQLRLSSYKGKLKPGIYTLNTSMTAREMMQVMSPVDKDTETETEAVKQTAATEQTTEGGQP